MKLFRLLAPVLGAMALAMLLAPASYACTGVPSANQGCMGPPSGSPGQFRARSIVGADLPIGSAVQAWDADLDALAGLATAADKLQYWTGSHTAALIDFPAWARSVISAASASAGRTAFGLAIGTDVQAYDAELAAIAGLTSAAGKIPYFTGAGTAGVFDSTTFGRSVSNVADAAALRTLSGTAIGTNVQAYDAELAALAGLTSAADKCAYFTGSGTAALMDCLSWSRAVSSAASASAGRTAFGLAIGADVQAYDAELAALAGLTSASGKVPYFTGSGSAAVVDSTTFGRSVLNVADAVALRTLGGAVIGTNVQAWDADLDCLAVNSTAGLLSYTGAGTCAARTLAAPAAGLTITNPAGTAGNPTFTLANDLAALEALSSTGIARRTGTDTWSVGGGVTNAELDTMPTARFKARATAGTGAPEDLTATQATALLDVAVGDSGSGGTKGLVPAPGAGDAAAIKVLSASMTWVAQSGGGGGSYPDVNRQNALLVAIYQSKSFAEYRRAILEFYTGFKGASDASNGILTASSQNYLVTVGTAGKTDGNVAPTVNAGSAIFPINMTTNSAPSPYVASGSIETSAAWQAFDGNSSSYWQATSASNETLKIDRGSGNAVASSSYSLTAANGFPAYMINSWIFQGSNDNSSWTNLDTRSAQASWSAAETRSYNLSAPSAAYRYFRLAISAGNTAGNYIVGSFQALGVGTTNNMTVVTAPQTTDSSVANVRLLAEIDNTNTPTLNTDIAGAVSCKLSTAAVTISNAAPGVITHTSHGLSADDPVILTTTGALPAGLTVSTTYFVKTVLNANSYTVSATQGGTVINTSSAGSGTHTASFYRWAAASFSAITSFSQGDRRVIESVDQACVESGTSFAGRIKTLTGKYVPLAGLTVTAH